MSKAIDKCARKFDHNWRTELETRTHVIKKCKWCKGRKWVPRRA